MHILIVEDEPVHARYLKSLLLESEDLKIDAIHVERTLLGARCVLEEHPIELVFLDLDVFGEDGFQLLRNAPPELATIIVSAYPERAIEAYEKEALDFIPKPATAARLKTALARHRRLRPMRNAASGRFALQEGGQTTLLPYDAILCFAAAGKRVLLHAANGAVHPITRRMEDLEEALPPQFERIHKSYIVNLDCVVRIEARAGGSYSVTLQDGAIVPVSRKQYANLKRRIASLEARTPGGASASASATTGPTE